MAPKGNMKRKHKGEFQHQEGKLSHLNIEMSEVLFVSLWSLYYYLLVHAYNKEENKRWGRKWI